MSRESIAAISVVLLPLLLTALTALVAVAVRAINRYTKDRRVALATELLALHAGAIVADISQHVVDALKDPAQAGDWDDIAKRTAKTRAVARLKSAFPHLVALVTESLRHPEQIEEVLGGLVEKGVVDQKAPAKPARMIVASIGATLGDEPVDLGPARTPDTTR